MRLSDRVMDPNDETDPRVILEWEDLLGQKIHVGDFVAYGVTGGLIICKVLLMQGRRQDGRPLAGEGLIMHLQPTRVRDKKLVVNQPSHWDRHARRNIKEDGWVPVVWRSKYPHGEVVKIDFHTDETTERDAL